jgi:exonuclease III
MIQSQWKQVDMSRVVNRRKREHQLFGGTLSDGPDLTKAQVSTLINGARMARQAREAYCKKLNECNAQYMADAGNNANPESDTSMNTLTRRTLITPEALAVKIWEGEANALSEWCEQQSWWDEVDSSDITLIIPHCDSQKVGVKGEGWTEVRLGENAIVIYTNELTITKVQVRQIKHVTNNICNIREGRWAIRTITMPKDKDEDTRFLLAMLFRVAGWDWSSLKPSAGYTDKMFSSSMKPWYQRMRFSVIEALLPDLAITPGRESPAEDIAGLMRVTNLVRGYDGTREPRPHAKAQFTENFYGHDMTFEGKWDARTRLRIISANIRGGYHDKIGGIEEYGFDMRADIILLGETKAPSHYASKPPDSESLGNYARLHAPNQLNHKRGGVAILVDKSLMARARHKQVMAHKEGRYLGICIQGCEGTKIYIVSYYGLSAPYNHPAEARETVASLAAALKEWGYVPGQDTLVIGGDTNTVADTSRDRKGYTPNASAEAIISEIHEQLLTSLQVTDAFRELHPDKPAFTFVRTNTTEETTNDQDSEEDEETLLTVVGQQARLDSIFVSTDLTKQHAIRSAGIQRAMGYYKTDHAPVIIDIELRAAIKLSHKENQGPKTEPYPQWRVRPLTRATKKQRSSDDSIMEVLELGLDVEYQAIEEYEKYIAELDEQPDDNDDEVAPERQDVMGDGQQFKIPPGMTADELRDPNSKAKLNQLGLRYQAITEEARIRNVESRGKLPPRPSVNSHEKTREQIRSHNTLFKKEITDTLVATEARLTANLGADTYSTEWLTIDECRAQLNDIADPGSQDQSPTWWLPNDKNQEWCEKAHSLTKECCVAANDKCYGNRIQPTGNRPFQDKTFLLHRKLRKAMTGALRAFDEAFDPVFRVNKTLKTQAKGIERVLLLISLHQKTRGIVPLLRPADAHVDSWRAWQIKVVELSGMLTKQLNIKARRARLLNIKKATAARQQKLEAPVQRGELARVIKKITGKNKFAQPSRVHGSKHLTEPSHSVPNGRTCVRNHERASRSGWTPAARNQRRLKQAQLSFFPMV